MTKSKRSAGSPAAAPPEFFLDRCLGRGVAKRLRERGWVVHLVADLFPDDGQHTPDEEWIAFGLSQGWALLTQDGRIRYRAAELSALADGQCVMFCPSSGNLRIEQRAERFDASRPAIYGAANRGTAAFYTVYADHIVKKWP